MSLHWLSPIHFLPPTKLFNLISYSRQKYQMQKLCWAWFFHKPQELPTRTQPPTGSILVAVCLIQGFEFCDLYPLPSTPPNLGQERKAKTLQWKTKWRNQSAAPHLCDNLGFLSSNETVMMCRVLSFSKMPRLLAEKRQRYLWIPSARDARVETVISLCGSK